MFKMNRFRASQGILYIILGTIAWMFPVRGVSSPIVVTQEVNLTDFAVSNYDLHYANAPMVTIANGDDVTVTFNFAGGSRLLLSNNSAVATSFATGWPWLESWGQSGFFNVSNISIALLNPELAGSGEVTRHMATHSDGSVHLGPLGYMQLDPYSAVSFSGITATYHVDSVPGGANSYQPWIHGYFNVPVSILDAVGEITAKQYEPLASERMICVVDSNAAFAIFSPPAVFSVPEGTSSAVLLVLGCLLLCFVPVRQAYA